MRKGPRTRSDKTAAAKLCKDAEELIWKVVIAEKPSVKRAHASLGVVLQQQGDFAGAGAAYRRAIAIDPNQDQRTATLDAHLPDEQGDHKGSAALAFRKVTAIDRAMHVDTHLRQNP